MHVCVVGAGYVGLVRGLGLATMGHDVTVVDSNRERIASLQAGEVPIHEPGLERQLLDCVREGTITFVPPESARYQLASVVLVCVGTPPLPTGAADLRAIWAVADAVADANRDALLTIKRTVPPGTGRRLAAHLAARGTPMRLASNPEFLREAHAVEDFARPDRIIIGTDDVSAPALLTELYRPFAQSGVHVLMMNHTSAELTKYAANAMLATRISFMNELASLAEATGADLESVRQGIGSDPRIGSAFLQAGPGYGGSCFPKDVAAILHTAEEHAVDLRIIAATEAANAVARRRALDFVQALMPEGVAGEHVAIWGVAFKAGTDDIRDSPSIALLDRLLEMGATVHLHDECASVTTAQRYAAQITAGTVRMEKGWSPLDAAAHTACLVVMTDDTSYRAPNLLKLGRRMDRRRLADMRAILRPDAATAAGFSYLGIGRAPRL